MKTNQTITRILIMLLSSLTLIMCENQTAEDENNPAIQISPGSISLDEGSSGRDVSFKLASQPEEDVTLELTDNSNSDDLTFNSTTLTFTSENWDTDQRINISAVSDTEEEGTENITVTASVTEGDDAVYTTETSGSLSVAVTEVTMPTTPTTPFEMQCSTPTNGISSNLRGTVNSSGGVPIEINANDWFYTYTDINNITDTFGGPWVEECLDKKNGAEYMILVGRVEQSTTAVGFFLWKVIGQYFAVGVVFANGNRYMCLSQATNSDSIEESKRLLKENRTLTTFGSPLYIFDPSNPRGRSCFLGFNLPWTRY